LPKKQQKILFFPKKSKNILFLAGQGVARAPLAPSLQTPMPILNQDTATIQILVIQQWGDIHLFEIHWIRFKFKKGKTCVLISKINLKVCFVKTNTSNKAELLIRPYLGLYSIGSNTSDKQTKDTKDFYTNQRTTVITVYLS
jgi:hypothetical protein